METLKDTLLERRKLLYALTEEIRKLEIAIINEEWKDKPECLHSESDVSQGKCPYGETYRGIVFCHNINCHK